jgi:polyisoprenoid-binding protein YceI
MKNFKNITALSISVLLLWSCSGTPKEDTSKDEVVATACFYKYNQGATVLEWTAYKFTEKAPVAGTFTDFTIDGTLESDDPMALLSSLKFKINTSSVETQNEDRNGKIVKQFFGTIGSPEITGGVKSISPDGKAVIEVMMAEISKEIQGDYTWEKNVFTFKSSMDVANWNATSGIEALNKICKDLHTGKDGVSKLWPEINLSFSTILQSDCN